METAVEAKFADGTYRFWLPLPQVFELERNCGSLLAIEERLRAAIAVDATGDVVFVGGGAATIKEIRETVRLALIGGNNGMVAGEEIEVGPGKATDLVDAYLFPARPIAEGASLAWRVLEAAIFGVQLKKKSKRTGQAETPEPLSKGQVIANCGAMGLDWRFLSLSGYFEALEAANTMNSPEEKPVEPSAGLKRFMSAHTS